MGFGALVPVPPAGPGPVPPDARSAARALLSETSPAPVLLHGEDRVVHGVAPMTDVDVAVAPEHTREALTQLLAVGARHGLQLVAVWPYDVRGLALFLAPVDLRFVLHIDVLSDRHGLGRYGLRTGPLEAAATWEERDGVRWRRPDEQDRWLYLVAKRLAKGQTQELGTLADSRPALDPRRVGELFAPGRAAEIRAAIDGRADAAAGAAVAARWRPEPEQLRRGLRRVAAPIGTWVNVVGGPVPELPPGARDLIREGGPARAMVARWRRGAVLTSSGRPIALADANLAAPVSMDAVAEVLRSRASRLFVAHRASVGLGEEAGEPRG